MMQPLSNWEDTSTKQAILDFVDKVTASGGDSFMPPAGRIATFDNDGTLWCEQPLAQGAFIAQRLAAMAKAADQKGPTLCLLVHHDDSIREVAYSAGAEKALKAAGTEGWTVISMKTDWNRVFSFQ
jgi:hypothetical protein